MVGGGREAFVGAVHRMAARLDGRIELVAGAFSSTPDKAQASGRDLGVDARRNYRTWQEMLEQEAKLPRGERIDFVSVVTPNHLHFAIAEGFVRAGFHVVCDKPMVTTRAEADALVRLVQQAKTVFAVTYNYTGYPLVKQAREMVRTGELGQIRKVAVEYYQGWLATDLERTGQKQAAWRTDPAQAGLGGAVGDIGSHAEQLVRYVTGLDVQSVCADLTSLVSGRALDDDASVLMRFAGGARGVLSVSQVCAGCENDLRLRVWGTKGGLDWRQEEPNALMFRPTDGPERVYRRGSAYLSEAAKRATRLPPGHPEGFIEAFASIYAAVVDAIQGRGGASSTFPM
jgi:predicted dehydrogenase